MASDLGARLRELREDVLGETQTVFGQRFKRTWKRVSAWENGQSAPPVGALIQAAREAGWPIEMFAEDGPYPKQALEPPKRPAEASKRDRPRSGPGRRSRDQAAARAADLEAAAARVREQIRGYEARREAPPIWQILGWVKMVEEAAGPSQPAADEEAPGDSPPGPPSSPRFPRVSDGRRG
jgi:hypothetical protein